jgi:transcriptional regulator with XRE-family HTH domain
VATDTRRPNRLWELRRAQNLTQKDVARQIVSRYGEERRQRGGSIGEATIARWEKRGPIPHPHQAELADIFKVSVAHLLGLDGPDGNGGERQAA